MSMDQNNIRDLAGAWRVRLDRDHQGISEQWFSEISGDELALPGSLQHARMGDPVTIDTPWMCERLTFPWFCDPQYAEARAANPIKITYWLQPETYFAGAAWYQRTIDIPENWRGKRVSLKLERPHWQTNVWLNDTWMGRNDSLCTPHVYELGHDLPPGKHRLTVQVDNSMIVDLGINSHSISDHTQGNWNGLVGKLELAATECVWIDSLKIVPNAAEKSIYVTGIVAANGDDTLPTHVMLEVTGASDIAHNYKLSPAKANVSASGTFTAQLSMGNVACLWDEFSPALYQLKVSIENGESKTVLFGLRDIHRNGRHFVLNGRTIYFRGTLECCAFPKSGNPPTDTASWKKLMQVVKNHGLNLIRFHSWCPPEAAFIAADELGLYLQVEVASWANTTVTLGDGKPVDAWLYQETARILNEYGNHPSFLLMAYGNEPAGEKHRAYLAQWMKDCRKDCRQLWTSGAGWPEIAENDFHVTYKPRVYLWCDELRSRINALPPETQTDSRNFIAQHSAPVISHEIGQWCAYPNYDEMAKYTGYLKPRNFEVFRDSLAAHHMLHQAHDFLMASGKLQTLCYKEEIESALRTPDMGGFQLLGLSDFPGQGTALVGLLDAFWESKGYVGAAEFKRFCDCVVPLARMDKRVWMNHERFCAEIDVANYGPTDLSPAHLISWQLIATDGTIATRGNLPAIHIPTGKLTNIGRIEISLAAIASPNQYKLVVTINDTSYENDWDVWIYPSMAPIEPHINVHIAQALDAQAQAVLKAGGNVLLLIDPRTLPESAGLGFSSIFWNTVWTRRQKPYTLGVLCDPKHPALRDFPTDFHSNWQWWYPFHHAQAMILDHMPAELQPIVQVIDDWNTNRKLGLLFECAIDNGKVLVCSVDLEKAPDPVNRQLLASVLKYISSIEFKPTVRVTVEQIVALTAGGTPPAISPV